jgi:hypothetical protein
LVFFFTIVTNDAWPHNTKSIKKTFEAYFYRTDTYCQHLKLTENIRPPLIFASMSNLLPFAGLLAVVPIYGAISRKIFCSYITLVQYVSAGSFCFDSKSKLFKHHSNSFAVTVFY